MKIIFLIAALVLCSTHHAQQVLTFKKQINLVPEGIAIDSRNGNIFVSSIGQKKIIKISGDGKASDFIQPGQDNFLEGLGMKVDAKTRQLWALSNIRSGNTFTSQIHAFDLNSGKTVHQFSLSDSIPRLFNDLLLEKTGNLLITDTYSSCIYRYTPAKKDLAVVVNDTSTLKWPNGLEFLDGNNIIVATYGKGLLKVNLKTKVVVPLPGYKDQAIAYGLDGLAINGNALYGVYNAGPGDYSTNAIVKYTLDIKRERIVAENIVARGDASFADPTTAAIHKGKLYVIANSHLNDFNKNKETVIGIENILTPLKLWVWPLSR